MNEAPRPDDLADRVRRARWFFHVGGSLLALVTLVPVGTYFWMTSRLNTRDQEAALIAEHGARIVEHLRRRQGETGSFPSALPGTLSEPFRRVGMQVDYRSAGAEFEVRVCGNTNLLFSGFWTYDVETGRWEHID